MSKNLYFLISIVLVLGANSASGTVALDVNNYSFEYDVDGNQITCSGGTMDDYIMGWYQGGAALFAGRSVSCACPSVCDNCWDPNSTNFPDGYVIAFFQTDVHIYQITDHVFEVGRRYILSWEGLGWGDVMVGSLFYGDNPDANIVASESVALTSSGEQPWTWNHGEIVFQVGDGAPCIGETIGIRLLAAGGVGDYLFADKVTLDKDWATTAWNENPEDGSDEVDRDVVLEWRPGLWVADVNGHEVYFGTSFAEVNDANTATAGVYRGPDDVGSYADPCDANLTIYTYDPPETLELVKTYYWRVDEVNEAYLGSDPPAGPWKGAVWSFEVEGRAKEPYPADDATGVAAEVVLHWTPGRDAATHDVYFGTDETAVSSATTLSAEFVVNQGPNMWDSANYDATGLQFSREYYWRIDEVNETAGTLVKGDVWGFATSDHITVDDFDSYADTTAIKAVWKDSSYYPAGENGAEVFLMETDPNFIRSGKSMGYYYRGIYKTGATYHGSVAEAATSDLEIGTDWIKRGTKALVLYFIGDLGNGQDTTGVYNGIHQDQMYIALEDGSATEGLVKYPDMNAVMEDWWHEWNIELAESGLSIADMNNVAKVYIGFGGTRVGQTKYGAGKDYGVGDTVYFDDIEVWPPRCRPSFSKGEGDSDGDCFIAYSDVYAIGRDWLESGGMVYGEPPDTNLLAAWYKFDEGVDQTVVNYGTYGATHNGMLGNTPAVDACDPLWITNDPCAARERCLEFDGDTEYVEIPPFDFNTNTLTITAWVKRNRSQEIFAGIVVAADPCVGNTKAGLQFGSTPGWNPTNTLNYTWPDDGPPYTWEFQSDLLVPDGEWAFVGLTVSPSEGVLYLYDGTMSSATNLANKHYVEEFDCVTDIGWNRSKGVTKRHFDGRIDDVRIFDYTLSPDEILYVANPAAMYYRALEDWRADADGDDKVDFKDYSIMANHWLDEILWPVP